MADHDMPGHNELRLPFLFVPEGEEPSPEWLAEHPGWVKVPAHFVPHETGSGSRQGEQQEGVRKRDGSLTGSADRQGSV